MASVGPCLLYHCVMSSPATSTGIPSLDAAIGGLPDGSICILGELRTPLKFPGFHTHFFFIEEDEHGLYSSILVKTLLSHFLHSSTSTYYVSHRKFIPHALPSRVTLPNSSARSSAPPMTESNIAWRYNSVAPIENSLSENNVAFDFGSLLTKEKIEDRKLSVDLITKATYDELTSLLTNCPSNVKRIIIEGLADAKSRVSLDQIPWLLFRLKSLTRSNPKLSVFITLNPYQLNENIKSIIRSISDCCIAMKSFQFPNPSYPDFDGLFLVHKLPTVNTICSHKNLDTLDLGFQIKSGRYLSIDTLTLPPDINDRSTLCKPALPKLDF